MCEWYLVKEAQNVLDTFVFFETVAAGADQSIREKIHNSPPHKNHRETIPETVYEIL